MTPDGKLDLGEGIAFPVAVPVGQNTLAIRPEAIKLAEEDNDGVKFEAVVVSISFLENTYRTVVRLGASELLIDCHFPNGVAPVPGSKLLVAIDQTKVTVIPPTT